MNVMPRRLSWLLGVLLLSVSPAAAQDATLAQVVTNMFDVTSGRSAGIQVQAITRAGTNNLAGTPARSLTREAAIAKETSHVKSFRRH